MSNGTDSAEPLEASKRQRTNGTSHQNGNGATNGSSPEEVALAHARAATLYIPFLSPENVLPPKMPTHEEMEQFLLGLRKKALVEEYFGES